LLTVVLLCNAATGWREDGHCAPLNIVGHTSLSLAPVWLLDFSDILAISAEPGWVSWSTYSASPIQLAIMARQARAVDEGDQATHRKGATANPTTTGLATLSACTPLPGQQNCTESIQFMTTDASGQSYEIQTISIVLASTTKSKTKGTGKPGSTIPTSSPLTTTTVTPTSTPPPNGAGSDSNPGSGKVSHQSPVPESSSSTGSSGISSGAAAGIGIGCAVAGAAIAALILLVLFRRRRTPSHSAPAGAYLPPGNVKSMDESPSGDFAAVGGAAALIDDFLPQPVEDGALSGELGRLQSLIKNHVSSYYDLKKDMPAPSATSLALGPNSPITAERLAGLLANADTRFVAIRFAIAWMLFGRAMDGDSSLSLLPPQLAASQNSMTGLRGKSDGTFLTYLISIVEVWQPLTLPLYSSTGAAWPMARDYWYALGVKYQQRQRCQAGTSQCHRRHRRAIFGWRCI
jgi:hypothetical protein